MKEVLQFERSITNPAGIEWVGSDLYMVAPVASAPGPSALYKLDPATGQATILGGLGVEDPTDIAWDSSMMYLIDNDSDALYTVRQIQAPSPPVATGIGTKHIGQLTLSTAPATTISKPRGLAWVKTVPPMDSIYMVDDDTDALYTVNTTTGVAGRVGNGFRIVDANDRVRGLAWGRGPGSDNQQGQHLYLLTDSALYRMNRGLGTADKIGSGMGVSDAAGLAWDDRDEDDGGRVMYMVNGGLSPALYTVNTTTGVATRVAGLSAGVRPSGLVWDGGSLYMGSTTGVLYEVNASTGAAAEVGTLGINTPTAFAWDEDSSIMYAVDDGTDALYAVTGVHPFLPNAGDLYYNGGDFADAFMRWDNPKWERDDEDGSDEDGSECASDIIKCSTYEHDLILEWRNDGGWFAIQRLGTRVPGVSPSFCTTWSDLPDPYDDCPTAGVSPDPGVVELSFGTFKAPLIEPGRDYYGSWRFQHQRGTGSTTTVKLYGQEGEYDSRVVNFLKCPRVTKDIWCIFGIGDGSGIHTGTTWSYDTPSYLKYSRP